MDPLPLWTAPPAAAYLRLAPTQPPQRDAHAPLVSGAPQQGKLTLRVPRQRQQQRRCRTAVARRGLPVQPIFAGKWTPRGPVRS